jgi:nucleotide-binding universal stress UspA family protein
VTRDRKYLSVDETPSDACGPQRTEGPTTALPPTSHVVVGFDRCPASHHALRFAIELAAPLNAFLHVAHIVDLQDFPVDPDGDDWEQCFVDTLEQERTTACDLLSALPGNWTYHAYRGDPAHVLSALADTHDALMIILGTARGGPMSAIDRVLGASVSARLIRHTHRPVVLVPDAAVPTKLNARAGSHRRHGELRRLTRATTPGAGNMVDTVTDNTFTHDEPQPRNHLGNTAIHPITRYR